MERRVVMEEKCTCGRAGTGQGLRLEMSGARAPRDSNPGDTLKVSGYGISLLSGVRIDAIF